ncbi:MAG TPA: glycoside hydrolase family 88 protein [Pyrinomonadaceae bacterium]|nr:glycoside hydrolase family 88 protein [Pyrinomonadaceae bacterium]
MSFKQSYLRMTVITSMMIATATFTLARPHPPSKDNGYSKKEIAAIMSRVYNWQIAHPVEINERNNNLWARAAFYTGIMAAYSTVHDRKYLDQAMKWSQSRDWKLGERPRHADDQAPAQTYLELYMLRKDPAMIAHTTATLDAMLNSPKPGREDWWWCDALFMSPPVLARLYAATRDQKYLKFMNTMWWDTTDFLFDPAAKLYYRDKNYFARLNPNGKKIFWARGNGWVMAGTVRVLQYLPRTNPDRVRYINLLKTMAASVSRLQGEDGLWRPSLLDQTEVPIAETSSSGFFCYAIAWGINHGYLDKKTYLPVVRKAWKGLVGAVNPDGKLGHVQAIGAAPATLTAEDNQEYGSGAFLLAGSEMMKLK